jgi:hypothetical protein
MRGQIFATVITVVFFLALAAVLIYGFIMLIWAHGERVEFMINLMGSTAKPASAATVLSHMQLDDQDDRSILTASLMSAVTGNVSTANADGLHGAMLGFFQNYEFAAYSAALKVINLSNASVLLEVSSTPRFCGNISNTDDLTSSENIYAYCVPLIQGCQAGREEYPEGNDVCPALYLFPVRSRCCKEVNYSFAPPRGFTGNVVKCGSNQEGICVDEPFCQYGRVKIPDIENKCNPGLKTLHACCKPLMLHEWLTVVGTPGNASIPLLWTNSSAAPNGTLGYISITVS